MTTKYWASVLNIVSYKQDDKIVTEGHYTKYENDKVTNYEYKDGDWVKVGLLDDVGSDKEALAEPEKV